MYGLPEAVTKGAWRGDEDIAMKKAFGEEGAKNAKTGKQKGKKTRLKSEKC